VSLTADPLPLNVMPAIRFSEPVVPSTVEGRFVLRTVGGSERMVPAGFVLQPDRQTLIVEPVGGLQPGLHYRLESTDGIEDDAGNTLSFSSRQEFTAAHTVDREPPRPLISPQDETGDVPVNALLSVLFNEPVRLADRERGAMELLRDGRAVPGTITTGSASFAFRPYLPLDPSSTYTIKVAGVRDLAGNATAAATASFRTIDAAGPPSTPFALVSAEPARGAADVPLDATIRFTFNRPIHPVTAGRFSVSASTGFIPGIVAVVQNALVFTPSVPLPPLTQIFAGFGIFSSGTLTDLAGQPLQGASSISFTTRAGANTTPPRLLSVSPQPGTVLPPSRRTFALRFSEPVQALSDGLRVLAGASLSARSISVGEDPSEVFLDVDVPPDTVLTISGTSALRDYAGNRAEPFSFEYRSEAASGSSGGTGAPRVLSTVPTEYSRVPAGRQPITFRFDRPMNAPSVLSSVRITQNGALVGGAAEMLDGDTAVRFTPDSPFTSGARIDRFILTSAMDTGGLALPQRYTNYFFIDGASPAGLQVTHTSLIQGAARGGTVALEFDRPLAMSSVHEGTVWILDAATGERVPARVSVEDGQWVQVAPLEGLGRGRAYKLVIAAGVQDADGHAGPGREIGFHAGPPLPDAPLESVTSDESSSGRLVRLRFAGPVNPLPSHAIRLLADGNEVRFNIRYSVEGDEWTLVPTEPQLRTTQLQVVLPDGANLVVPPPPPRN
jgi:hypothetical protein